MRELRKLSKAKMLEIFAAEYIKTYGYGGVANEQNLKPVQTKSEARERGRNG